MVDRRAIPAVGVAAPSASSARARASMPRAQSVPRRPCLGGQPIQRVRGEVGPPTARRRLDQLAQAPVLRDDLSMLAGGRGGRERVLVTAETVGEHGARVGTDGQSDALSAGARLALGRLDEVRGLALPASPRRDHQRSVGRGADARRLLDGRRLGNGGCRRGEVAAEHEHGRASAEGERQLAERPGRAGDLDAGARQGGRVFVVPDLQGEDAALPQPAQPLLGRSLAAGEPLHRLSAERDGRWRSRRRGSHERVQQQVRGRGYLAAAGVGARRGQRRRPRVARRRRSAWRRTTPRRTRRRTSRARQRCPAVRGGGPRPTGAGSRRSLGWR